MGKKLNASNIKVEVQILKDLPVDEIEEYMDLTIYGVARATMDYTLSDNRFPYRTGNLQRSSMAHDPRKEKEYTYCLDVPAEADYAKYVWNMENVNWTNLDTYSKWFETVYKEKKDIITQNAVNNAIRSVK